MQILRTPTAFYESLIERCDRATTRVTLSALYWGTGPLALNLAEAVARAASRGVAVNVTLDAARAGRRDKDGRTSVDALAAVEEAGGDIHLVDASGRSGLIGEILGVYHAKACVFDDATLLTGANLSEEYFRSRQDRYVVVRDHKVADWYDRAVRAATAAPDAGERARALRELCTGSQRRRRRGAAASTGRGGGPRRRSSRRRKCAIFWTSTRARCPPCWTRVRAAASPRPTRTRRPPSSKRSADGRDGRRALSRHARLRRRDGRQGFPAPRTRSAAWDLATKLKGSGDVRAPAPRETYHAKGCWAFSAGDERPASARRSSGPRTGTCGRIGATSSLGAASSCATARCGAASATSGAGCGRRARSGVGSRRPGRHCVFCGPLPSVARSTKAAIAAPPRLSGAAAAWRLDTRARCREHRRTARADARVPLPHLRAERVCRSRDMCDAVFLLF